MPSSFRPGRRTLLGALLPLPADCLATPADAIVEPRMRLAVPADGVRRVALTLDACGGAVDMRILDTLLRLGLPATIFVTARWLRDNAEAVALLRANPALLAVQNHGARHLAAVLGSGRIFGQAVAGTTEAMRAEVAGGAASLQEAGFPPPRWYRGATALYSSAALPMIEAMGSAIAGFSLNGDEGASLPAAAVARRVMAATTGEVIIAHLNQPGHSSGAGLVAGLNALHAAGVEFVVLGAFPVTPLDCRRRSSEISATKRYVPVRLCSPAPCTCADRLIHRVPRRGA
jgi:peptidoglycan/xylan/chitin deacetylase (PgdA/CDA1 family)